MENACLIQKEMEELPLWEAWGWQSTHGDWVWETDSDSTISLIKLATSRAILHPGHVLGYVTMSTYCAPGDMLDTVATLMSKAGVFTAFWVGGVGSQAPG